MTPALEFRTWQANLRSFSERLPDALTNARLGIQQGGLPETVTNNILVHPLLRMLGFDPEDPKKCLPQGRVPSPSKAGKTRFQRASSDWHLHPLGVEGCIPLEIKSLVTPLRTLKEDLCQLDQYMRLNRSHVGIKSNGHALLVFAYPEKINRDDFPRLVAEFDLSDIDDQKRKDLFWLHHNHFLEWHWIRKASRLIDPNLPDSIEFARVDPDIFDAVNRHIPKLTKSEILRNAIIDGMPKINQIQIGVEEFFQRVKSGAIHLRPHGFKLEPNPEVVPLLQELHRRYPIKGTSKERYGADTVIGFLVEEWARNKGFLGHHQAVLPETFQPSNQEIQEPGGSSDSITPFVEIGRTQAHPETLTRDHAFQLAQTLAKGSATLNVYRMWHPQATKELVTRVSLTDKEHSPPAFQPKIPTLILMVGITGSGKTAWVRDHLRGLNPAICSADHFCVDLDGTWCWSHETVVAAHAICKRAFNEIVAGGHPLIVVDNQNLMAQHRQHYLDWARKHDYQCFLIVLDCDDETAFKRGIHGVTLNGIQRQRERRDLAPGIYYIPVKRHASALEGESKDPCSA